MLKSLRRMLGLRDRAGNSSRASQPPRRRVLGVEQLETRLVPAANNLHWAGPAGGNWSAAANWTEGIVPVAGNGDTVNFDTTSNTDSTDNIAGLNVANMVMANTYTKTVTISVFSLEVDGNLTVKNGTIGGTATTTLAIPNATSTFTWEGGTIAVGGLNVGTAGNAPTWTIDGGAVNVGGFMMVESYANTTMSSTGDLGMATTSTFENRGTFNVTVDHAIGTTGVTSLFDNFGTFEKTVGAGGSQTDVYARMLNTDRGVVSAQSGTLHFDSTFKQTDTGGVTAQEQTTLAGGSIKADNGFLLEAGLLNGAGTFTGNITMSGTPTEVIPGVGTTAAWAAPGTLNVVGNFTMNAGELVININPAGTIGRLNVQSAGGMGGTMTIAAGCDLWVNRDIGYTPALGVNLTYLNATAMVGSFTAFLPNNSWTNGGARFFVDHEGPTMGWLAVN